MKTTKKSLFRKVLCAAMILCVMFSLMAVTAAAGDPRGKWFSYCEDGNHLDAIGTGGPDVFEWAIKIPVASLPEQNILTKVSFCVEETATYTLHIYESTAGATNPGAASPDYEQEIIAGNTGWNEFILTTPYEVDQTKDLWIAIQNATAYYPAARIGTVSGNPDSCMMHFQGDWMPVDQLGSFDQSPWMIRGILKATPLPPTPTAQSATSSRRSAASSKIPEARSATSSRLLGAR